MPLAKRVRAIVPAGVDAVVDFIGGQLETTLAVLGEVGAHASVVDASITEHGGIWVWVRPDGHTRGKLVIAP